MDSSATAQREPTETAEFSLLEVGPAPATVALCLSWIVVYILMMIQHGSFAFSPNPLHIGLLSIPVTHAFGDMTSAELWGGQFWRALTATFVHYSLVHLLLNLIGLYQLGRLVETWYGSGPLLAIYVATGGLGNLIAGLARPWFGIHPLMHSGGGSTVVFGLIGLCAVGGWQSQTRIGNYLRGHMIFLLILNGLIGLGIAALVALVGLFTTSVDNFAHAGGALIGALIGLGHRRLVRLGHRAPARLAGVVAVAALVVCGVLQARVVHLEHALVAQWQTARQRWQNAQAPLTLLGEIQALYFELARWGYEPRRAYAPNPRLRPNPDDRVFFPILVQPVDDHPLPALRQAMRERLRALEAHEPIVASEATATPYRDVRILASRALTKPPTLEEIQEFAAAINPLLQRVRDELQQAQRQAQSAESRIVTLRQQGRF